jgi:peptide/nickel transport system substrate-binding protein
VAAILLAVTAAAGAAKTSAPPPKIDLNATIKIGYLSTTLTLDPAKFSPSPTVQMAAWDRLTTLDDNGNLRPMLATSWVTSKDGKSITLKLRTDVKFHDGTPLDATAVKASLDRAMTLPGSTAAAYLADVASVDVVDKSTVRINLKFGGAELPRILSTPAGAVINPKCIANNTPLDLAPPAACTSSAMVFDHATPPLDWFLTRAPGKYWDPKAFRYKALEMHQIPNTQTGINGVQTGDIDIYWVNADGVAQSKSLIRSGALAGKPFVVPGLNAFFLNPRIPPFNNVLLRQAVQAAFNQVPLAHDYYSGNCAPSQQPAVPSSFAYDKKWNPNPYNPDRAKQLLAQAGVPDGFSFTMDTAPLSSNVAATQVLQDELAKVGIKMAIRVDATSADPQIRNGSAQASSAAWGPGPDPSIPVTWLLNIPDNRLAVALGSSVENQIQTLRFHALDPRLSLTQRGKVYQQIWKIAYNNALMVNMCLLGAVFLHNKKLINGDRPPYTLESYGIDPRYLAKQP